MAIASFKINLEELNDHANYVMDRSALHAVLNKEVKIAFDSKHIGTAIITDLTDGAMEISASIVNDNMLNNAITNKLERFALLPRYVGRHEIVDGKTQLKMKSLVAFNLVPQSSISAFITNDVLKLQVRDFFTAFINITQIRGVVTTNPEDSYVANEVMLYHLAKVPTIKQVLGTKEEEAWEEFFEKLERTSLPTVPSIIPILTEVGRALLHLFIAKRLVESIPTVELPMHRYGFESKNRQILDDIDKQINIITSQLIV